ncbi:hypothetical protein RI129_007216 [Pyrocoelia pectoralis]|uniref:G-protein coupled receptors family 1 profile domain-containing protein n=1 Tax=Pyrocoelia pectoralis TaxID=417401 RepID=A0AAN7ZMD2_9COLE
MLMIRYSFSLTMTILNFPRFFCAIVVTPTLLSDTMDLTNEDGYNEWRNEEASILSNIVKERCSVNWEEQALDVKTYIIFLFVFGLLFPLIVIGHSYISIIIRLKQQPLPSGQVKKSERRITISILVMIVAFLTAWMPYAVMALIAQFGKKNSITPSMGVIPAIIAKSSVCYNPIIYVAFNTQFISRNENHGRVSGRKRRTSQFRSGTEGVKSSFQQNCHASGPLDKIL